MAVKRKAHLYSLVSKSGVRVVFRLSPGLSTSGWVVNCKTYPSVITQGRTLAHAMGMLKEAWALWSSDEDILARHPELRVSPKPRAFHAAALSRPILATASTT